MPNVTAATVTVTGSTGPGQTVTTLKFTDVVDLEVDFIRSWLKITRAGSGGITYYDYSALSTVTWAITSNITAITFA